VLSVSAVVPLITGSVVADSCTNCILLVAVDVGLTSLMLNEERVGSYNIITESSECKGYILAVSDSIVDNCYRVVVSVALGLSVRESEDNIVGSQSSASAGLIGRRIELRSPDPAANPYLALAVCLSAGLDGIRNKIMPPAPITGNITKLSDSERSAMGIEQLPGTLIEAISEFEKDEFVRNVIGEHISNRYVEARKREWAQYTAQISEWEIEQYLNKI
jgi:glutamine synthetase